MKLYKFKLPNDKQYGLLDLEQEFKLAESVDTTPVSPDSIINHGGVNVVEYNYIHHDFSDFITKCKNLEEAFDVLHQIVSGLRYIKRYADNIKNYQYEVEVIK